MRRLPVLVLGCAVTVTYAGAYSKAEHGPIREGIGDPYFLDVCRYIRQNTRPDECTVFDRPRLLSLLTGHPATTYDYQAPETATLDFWRYVNARYLIVTDLPNPEFRSDHRYLRDITAL